MNIPIDWFIMSYQEYLYDLFFEISSQERHKILLSVMRESANLTHLSNQAGLNLPETRRHVTRLTKVGLIKRIPDGSYYITNFGKRVLEQVDTISFFLENRDYFQNHVVDKLPHEFKIRLGDLASSNFYEKMLDFLQKIEQIVTSANETLFIFVDEIPYLLIPSIIGAISRGVEIRLITKEIEAPNPETGKIFYSSLTQHSVTQTPDILLVFSDQMAAVAFPNLKGEIDYSGFASKDKWTLNWARALFDVKWGEAISTPNEKQAHDEAQIVIIGRDNPIMDLPAVQDAVDHYEEVVLKGVFDFGSSRVTVSKSCKISGSGRENDIPQTKVHKSGWQIPFTSDEHLFLIKGKDIEVSIENIHFTDFNGICVAAYEGGVFRFEDNRMTLETGFARGRRHPYCDMIVGLMVGDWSGPEEGVRTFPRGVEIIGNYLDFALSHLRGGYISPGNKWDRPDYHPDLHEEYYGGIGIFVFIAESKVIIKNNIVKNVNTVGINLQDSYETAWIIVEDNEITTDVYGSHVHGWIEAGYSIAAHSIFAAKEMPGYKIDIVDNNIECNKPGYSGINICGSFNTQDYAKFLEGTVSGNKIHLMDGLTGIKVGRSDNITVSNNSISGRAYYGIRIHGKSTPNDRLVYSEKNIVSGNDMSSLDIKVSDEFVGQFSDGFSFEEEGRTAHIWLDDFTKLNQVEHNISDIVIDEGKRNTITNSN